MPQYHAVMAKAGPLGPFKPSYTEIVTTDQGKFLAWWDRQLSMGWQPEDEYEAWLNMLRAMSAKRMADLSKPYNPSPEQVALDRAHRPSGNGQKPFRKPVRDYQGGQMPKGPWTGERNVMPAGPDKPQVSTKRFPHLGGKTGPQSRGE